MLERICAPLPVFIRTSCVRGDTIFIYLFIYYTWNQLMKSLHNEHKMAQRVLLGHRQLQGRASDAASVPCKLDSIFAFIRQVAPVPACWLFKTGWPFDLESGVRVTSCDVGYLSANFSLPRHLCSRVRSDVRDRYTDVRQKHRNIKHNNSNQIKFICWHRTMPSTTSKQENLH